MPSNKHRKGQLELPPEGRGKPLHSLRWSLLSAAREFNVEKQKISRRLKALSLSPGEDECYSTAQIAQAIFGSYEAERIRNTAAIADNHELDIMEKRRKLISLEAEKEMVMEIGVNIRQKILALPLSPEQIDGILIEVQRIMLSHTSSQAVCKRLGITKLVAVKTDEN